MTEHRRGKRWERPVAVLRRAMTPINLVAAFVIVVAVGGVVDLARGEYSEALDHLASILIFLLAFDLGRSHMRRKLARMYYEIAETNPTLVADPRCPKCRGLGVDETKLGVVIACPRCRVLDDEEEAGA